MISPSREIPLLESLSCSPRILHTRVHTAFRGLVQNQASVINHFSVRFVPARWLIAFDLAASVAAYTASVPDSAYCARRPIALAVVPVSHLVRAQARSEYHKSVLVDAVVPQSIAQYSCRSEKGSFHLSPRSLGASTLAFRASTLRIPSPPVFFTTTVNPDKYSLPTVPPLASDSADADFDPEVKGRTPPFQYKLYGDCGGMALISQWRKIV